MLISASVIVTGIFLVHKFYVHKSHKSWGQYLYSQL